MVKNWAELCAALKKRYPDSVFEIGNCDSRAKDKCWVYEGLWYRRNRRAKLHTLFIATDGSDKISIKTAIGSSGGYKYGNKSDMTKVLDHAGTTIGRRLC